MQHQTPSTGRFVDLDELICRDCGDEVADGRDGSAHDAVWDLESQRWTPC